MKIRRFNENIEISKLDDHIQYIVDSMNDYISVGLSHGYSDESFDYMDNLFYYRLQHIDIVYNAYRLTFHNELVRPDKMGLNSEEARDIKILFESFDKLSLAIESLKSGLIDYEVTVKFNGKQHLGDSDIVILIVDLKNPINTHND